MNADMDPDEDAENIFSALSEIDREVLARFYLEGENAAQICAEMDLSMARFLTVKRTAMAAVLARKAAGQAARAAREQTRFDMNADMNADRVMLIVLNVLPEGSREMLGPSPITVAVTADQTVSLRIRPHLRRLVPMCRCGCGGRKDPYTRAGRQAILDCIKFGWRRL
jgi:hypothetical protein